MSNDFTFDGDLPRISASASEGAEDGLTLALEHVLEVANQDVPIEEGTLQRSGETAQDGLRGVVYYNTPYALVQHEDMTLRHDAGRTAKFLENALNSQRETVKALIAAGIRRKLGTS